jgi:seryl-tRNA synthetase
MNKSKVAIIIGGLLFFSGCNQQVGLQPKVVKSKKFKEPNLKLKNADVLNEFKYVNKKLNNNDERIKVLNKKVNIISKKDNNYKELKNRVDEHEKVLMTLMNDVINISKGQQNLKKSDQVIYEQMSNMSKEIKSLKDGKKFVKSNSSSVSSEKITNTAPVIVPKPIKNTNPILSVKSFKASTFELMSDTVAKDKPNGQEIEVWEKGTRFTSYIKHGNWVKATGVIKDLRWNKVSSDYWLNTKTLKKLR